jgi:hypothetical protein
MIYTNERTHRTGGASPEMSPRRVRVCRMCVCGLGPRVDKIERSSERERERERESSGALSDWSPEEGAERLTRMAGRSSVRQMHAPSRSLTRSAANAHRNQLPTPRQGLSEEGRTTQLQTARAPRH